ncbi:MAG: site-specific integrase [Thermoguttaceae bacterium]
MTTPNILSTQWHVYQGTGQTCEICGCPARPLVDYKPDRRPTDRQQHHATEGPAASRWEKRWKTPKGWKTEPICRHRRGHRQREERPRITEGVRQMLAAAAAMSAAGAKTTDICRKVGTSGHLFWEAKHRHMMLWSELVAQSQAMLNVLAETRKSDVPRRSFSPVLAELKVATNPQGALAGTVGTGQTLWNFFAKTYVPMRLIGRSKATVISYKVAISRLCQYAGRAVTLGDLTDEFVSGFMARMLEKGASAPTVNCKRRCIMALWRFAYRRKDKDGRRLVAEMPEVEKLKEFKRVPVAWTVEEISRLLARAAKEPGTIGDVPARSWWKGLILFLYYTGARINAALQIRRDDLALTPEGGYVLVRAEYQKQKADQQFNLSSECAQAVLEVLGDRDGRVFVWPGDRRRLDRTFRQMLLDAGLSPGVGACPLFHKMRKTSATQIAAKLGRAAACDHLGHSCMSVTERYLDPRQMPNVRAADVLPAPIVAEPSVGTDTAA